MQVHIIVTDYDTLWRRVQNRHRYPITVSLFEQLFYSHGRHNKGPQNAIRDPVTRTHLISQVTIPSFASRFISFFTVGRSRGTLWETWPQITFYQIYIYINLLPTVTTSRRRWWSSSTHALLPVSRLPGRISNGQRRQRSEDVPHYICTLHVYNVHSCVFVTFIAWYVLYLLRLIVVYTDYPGRFRLRRYTADVDFPEDFS